MRKIFVRVWGLPAEGSTEANVWVYGCERALHYGHRGHFRDLHILLLLSYLFT